MFALNNQNLVDNSSQFCQHSKVATFPEELRLMGAEQKPDYQGLNNTYASANNAMASGAYCAGYPADMRQDECMPL